MEAVKYSLEQLFISMEGTSVVSWACTNTLVVLGEYLVFSVLSADPFQP
jgi:hypothetical protein